MVERPARVVLLVDDYESMRDAIARLLNAAGYECIAFVTAESLLAHGPGVGAVCVLSDLKMPGMTGLELLIELRRRGGYPPAILMTAHDAPGVREEAMRRGAAGYLAKPFQADQLMSAIEDAIAANERDDRAPQNDR
jgi:FixJ family two-component response regulator